MTSLLALKARGGEVIQEEKTQQGLEFSGAGANIPKTSLQIKWHEQQSESWMV